MVREEKMDGEDGEESDLQLFHPLSVSPPTADLSRDVQLHVLPCDH